MVNLNLWIHSFKYYVIPTTCIAIFFSAVLYLSIIGQGEEFSLKLALENLLGDGISWKWMLIFWVWAIIWLKAPSEIANGSETKFGTRSCIKANGVSYYYTTLITFFLLHAFDPNISTIIYSSFPKLMGVLSILGLVLCLILLIKGKIIQAPPVNPNSSKSLTFEFFQGIELHPTLFGCDIKQLIICRIMYMGLQLLFCAFYIVEIERQGFNTASLVHLLLRTVYISKFFYWEVGYFFSFTMYEQAGFYLCWGILVVVPVFYTFSAAYNIILPPTISPLSSILIGMFGLAGIILRYRVDNEKLLFRQSANFDCIIWGKTAKFIPAEYKDWTGKSKKSALLVSGFWRLTRHMNYTFELVAFAGICACLGFDRGIWNFLPFLYLPIFIIIRIIQVERQCKTKYGQYWEKYCSLVPYKIIPGIW